MRVVIFSGSHSRHAYVHEKICKNFDVCGAVIMQREPVLPGNNIKGNKKASIFDWPEKDQELYEYHFKLRDQVERKYYKEKSVDLYDSYCDVLKVLPNDLNSQKVIEFLKAKKPDLCFIFGTGIIKKQVTDIMPEWKINMHLGLSPWYRGSATLFWPFYNLQPQYAGVTLHQIIDEPDAGDILHQSAPVLHRGDTLHEVGAKVVVQAAIDTIKILKKIKEGSKIKLQGQKNSGKNFLIKDFEPHHLRLIYEQYDDKIVDEWLKGNLGDRRPNLVKGI